MRTIVDHEVMFLLDKGEGEVLRAHSGYARLTGVTVHLREHGTTVWAGAMRCKKDGGVDARCGTGLHVSVDLPDPELWIERAWQAVRG